MPAVMATEHLELEVDNGDEAMEVEAEEEGDVITGISEAREPGALREPHLPSKAEIADHYRHHIPFRNWCPVCLAAAGREEPHRRNAMDREGEEVTPTFAFDYDHFGEGVTRKNGETKTENDVTAMVMKNNSSGMVWAHTASCKGAKDAWLVKKITKDIEYVGKRDVRLKCD